MNEPKYKHFFSIRNGKFEWEEKDMFEFKRKSLEGRRGYAIIEEVQNDVTPSQYAYYFGGIIRKECMKSEVFQGLSEKQVHQVLFADLRSSVRGIKHADGTVQLVTVTEDFGKYKKKDMQQYIEELIPHLQVEYNIHPKPASHYKYNKFYFNEKHLPKHEN